MKSESLITFLVFVLLVVSLVFGPLAIIWAINTLFPVAAIPYTFWHWLAVAVLSATWFNKFQFPNKD